jgi:hypothetical protein
VILLSVLLVTLYVCIVCTLFRPVIVSLPPCEHRIAVKYNSNNNNNNNSVQFFIIYVPSQQLQGQLQTQHIVDNNNNNNNNNNKITLVGLDI